jgi:hypothetical protein
MIKKPVKAPIQSNFKRVVVSVQKDEPSVETYIRDKLGTSTIDFKKFENLLNQEYNTFVSKNCISKKKNAWLLDN